MEHYIQNDWSGCSRKGGTTAVIMRKRLKPNLLGVHKQSNIRHRRRIYFAISMKPLPPLLHGQGLLVELAGLPGHC
jgi:hypothetical protein